MENRFIRALQIRNFAFLWCAQLLSSIGDGLRQIALPWLTLRYTESAISTGITFALGFLPYVALAPFAGVFTDRWNRKKILILSDLGRSAAVLVIPILYVYGPFSIWVIYLSSFLLSVFEIFFTPAREASIPNAVPDELLDTANALDSMSQSVTRLMGILMGGTLILWLGTTRPLYIDSASFFVSALLITAVVLPRSGKSEVHVKTILRDLREGWGYIVGSPLLLSILGIGIVMNFSSSPIMLALPLLSDQVLHSGSLGFALLSACSALGTVCGAFVVGARKGERGLQVIKGIFFEGASVLFIPLSILAVSSVTQKGIILHGVTMVCIFVMGIGYALINIPLSSLLQSVVPDTFRGRVRALHDAVLTIPFPIALFLAGVLASRVSILHVMLLMGSLTLLTAILALSTPLKSA